MRILCRQYSSGRRRYLARGREAVPKDLVRMLLLVPAVLPGRRWNSRPGQLRKPLRQLADVTPGSAGGVLDIPLLSPIPRSVGRRETPRRGYGVSPHADD